ncbi:MAG: aspartate racemase/maleate isomerase family protein [Aeromicrobium sp.]
MTAILQPHAATRRIGLLAPFAELPGEYVDVIAEASEPAIAWQVVTESPDSHALADLRAMGSDEILMDGAQRLKRWRPDIVMWACTSGSFVLGRNGARHQATLLQTSSAVPASSTSLAFWDALRSIGCTDVSVLSPYPEAATQAFLAFLLECGVRVADVAHLGHPGARSSELLDAQTVRSAISDFRTDCLVLLPDTAVWGFTILEQLEGEAHQLLVANQVTLWQAFRMLGLTTDTPRFGVLRGCV